MDKQHQPQQKSVVNELIQPLATANSNQIQGRPYTEQDLTAHTALLLGTDMSAAARNHMSNHHGLAINAQQPAMLSSGMDAVTMNAIGNTMRQQHSSDTNRTMQTFNLMGGQGAQAPQLAVQGRNIFAHNSQSIGSQIQVAEHFSPHAVDLHEVSLVLDQSGQKLLSANPRGSNILKMKQNQASQHNSLGQCFEVQKVQTNSYLNNNSQSVRFPVLEAESDQEASRGPNLDVTNIDNSEKSYKSKPSPTQVKPAPQSKPRAGIWSRQMQSVFNILAGVMLALSLSSDIQILGLGMQQKILLTVENEPDSIKIYKHIELLTFIISAKGVILVTHLIYSVAITFFRDKIPQAFANESKPPNQITNNHPEYFSGQSIIKKSTSRLDRLNFPWLIIILLAIANLNSFIMLHNNSIQNYTQLMAQYQQMNQAGNNSTTDVLLDQKQESLMRAFHVELIFLMAINLFTLYFLLPVIFVFSIQKLCRISKKWRYLHYGLYILSKVYPLLQLHMFISAFYDSNLIFTLSSAVRYFVMEACHFNFIMLLATNYEQEGQCLHTSGSTCKEHEGPLDAAQKRKSFMHKKKETEELLEKLPEGILIVNEEGQVLFMNSELTQVMNIVNSNDQQSGLSKKIFTKYFEGEQSEDQNNSESSEGSTDFNNGPIGYKQPEKQWECLQEMIEDAEWTFDQDRYYEMAFINNNEGQSSPANEEQPSNDDAQRVFTQIRKLDIHFQERPAKMLVIRNITFIVEFEKVRNENKYQELLTATMSHEMLTPLNSIINLSVFIEQRLRRKFNIPEDPMLSDGSRGGPFNNNGLLDKNADIVQALSFIHIIKSSANILQYLVKDLIDLMNIKLNKFNPDTQQFSPMDACHEVLQCFEIQAKEKNLYIRRHVEGEFQDRVTEIVSDKQRYQQILLNIIQNGIKFTYQGGVEVVLDFQSSDKSGCPDCGELVTTVKDTGCGMDQALQTRLFRIFGTVNNNYGHEQSIITTQGIGLGLTICKQLCEKLGGKIALSSIPMEGTDVTFSLPFTCKQCDKQKQKLNKSLSLQSRINATGTNGQYGTANEEVLAINLNHPSQLISYDFLQKAPSPFPKKDIKNLRDKVSAMCLASQFTNQINYKKQPFVGEFGRNQPTQLTLANGYNHGQQSISVLGCTPKSKATDRSGVLCSPRDEFEKFGQKFGRTAEIIQQYYRNESQEIQRGGSNQMFINQQKASKGDYSPQRNNYGVFMGSNSTNPPFHIQNQDKRMSSKVRQEVQMALLNQQKRKTAVTNKGTHGSRVGQGQGDTLETMAQNLYFPNASSVPMNGNHMPINMRQGNNHHVVSETRLLNGSDYFFSSHYSVNDKNGKMSLAAKVQQGTRLVNGSKQFKNKQTLDAENRRSLEKRERQRNRGGQSYLLELSKSSMVDDMSVQSMNREQLSETPTGQEKKFQIMQVLQCRDNDLSRVSKKQSRVPMYQQNASSGVIQSGKSRGYSPVTSPAAQVPQQQYSYHQTTNTISVGGFEKRQEEFAPSTPSSKMTSIELGRQHQPHRERSRSQIQPQFATIFKAGSRGASPPPLIVTDYKENNTADGFNLNLKTDSNRNFLGIITNDDLENHSNSQQKKKQGTACFNADLERINTHRMISGHSPAPSSSHNIFKNFGGVAPAYYNHVNDPQVQSLYAMNEAGEQYQGAKDQLRNRDFTLALADIYEAEAHPGTRRASVSSRAASNRRNLFSHKEQVPDISHFEMSMAGSQQVKNRKKRVDLQSNETSTGGGGIFMQVPKSSNSYHYEQSPNFPNNISQFPTIRKPNSNEPSSLMSSQENRGRNALPRDDVIVPSAHGTEVSKNFPHQQLAISEQQYQFHESRPLKKNVKINRSQQRPSNLSSSAIGLQLASNSRSKQRRFIEDPRQDEANIKDTSQLEETSSEQEEETKEQLSQYPGGFGLNDGESSEEGGQVGLMKDSLKKPQKECACEATILIVDDNMFNLIPLELILTENFKINVDKALNGQEAVNIYQKNLLKTCCNVRYRLILMDLNMPIMDGYEATGHILSLFHRKQQSLMQQPNFNSHASQDSESNLRNGGNTNGNHGSIPSRIHVVAVTAFSNDENIKHCYRVGMADVMHKPVKMDVLKRVLDQYYYATFNTTKGEQLA